jgi:hypothetical protein
VYPVPDPLLLRKSGSTWNLISVTLLNRTTISDIFDNVAVFNTVGMVRLRTKVHSTKFQKISVIDTAVRTAKKSMFIDFT